MALAYQEGSRLARITRFSQNAAAKGHRGIGTQHDILRTAGHSLLYDTGPRYSPTSDAGQRIVVPLLRALGERPDTVVVSHRDSDHAGGSAAVQTEWPEARWLSSFDADPARRCIAGQRWTWDGVDFEILHPSPEDFGPDGTGRLPSNAMSCVLRVGHARQSVWLSGDLDADRETRLALARPDLRANLLLAPHHGSLTSSSPVLLNTLAPAWALVQAGYRNRFNHPAPAVLARYRERDMRWVATPDCGAATWRSDVPDTVVCQREAARRYWHHRGEASQPAEPVQAPAAPIAIQAAICAPVTRGRPIGALSAPRSRCRAVRAMPFSTRRATQPAPMTPPPSTTTASASSSGTQSPWLSSASWASCARAVSDASSANR